MVQMIYKELMLMGLVSFTVIMIEASKSDDHSGEPNKWIVGNNYIIDSTSRFILSRWDTRNRFLPYCHLLLDILLRGPCFLLNVDFN